MAVKTFKAYTPSRRNMKSLFHHSCDIIDFGNKIMMLCDAPTNLDHRSLWSRSLVQDLRSSESVELSLSEMN